MKRTPIGIGVAGLILASLACVFPLRQGGLQPLVVSSAVPLVPAIVAPPATAVPPAANPAPSADLAALYRRVDPGVVAILIYANSSAAPQTSAPVAQGSGFVIDTQGHIVTNQHVVDGAEQIEIDFPSGLKAWAKVLGTDPDSDLAVLLVDVPADKLVPLPLGDSDQVQVGDTVLAIGNPFGLSGTMTEGIVSAIGRTLDSERTAPGGQPFTAGDIIQTDAAINPGNSGGPLLNLRGEVVGVNRAIRTESFTVAGDAANSGVGFAVPVNIVKRVVPELIQSGKYDYPYMGISSLSDQAWNLSTLEALGLPPDAQGAYITCVTPGGPADKAGVIGSGTCDETALRPGGDLIVAIDGHPMRTFNDMLSYLIGNTRAGQEITLTVLRQGKEVQLPLTLGARP
jgi:2-alkenal reductase